MINNDLQKLIKQSIAINAAIAPINSWLKLYQEPALKAAKRNNLLTSTIEASIPKMLKSSAQIASINHYSDIVHNKTIKGIGLLNSPLWNLTGAIVTNQHNISAAIAKSVTVLEANAKAQVGSRTILGLRSFFETNFPLGYSSKLATLDATLKGLSAQIVFRGYDQPNAEFLERFSSTTDKAAAMTAELTEKNSITIEDIKNLEAFIGEQIEELANRISERIDKTAKSTFAKLNLWVGIISILLTLVTIYQACQSQNVPNEKAATKEDIQKLMQYTDERFKKILNEASFKAKTRIASHLRYKPSSKSRCMLCIKPGEIVHIIESNHKWVQVTVVDSVDNLPITGWIMRKHLIRS